MSLIYTQQMQDSRSKFTIKEILGEERYLELMLQFYGISYEKMAKKPYFNNKKQIKTTKVK